MSNGRPDLNEIAIFTAVAAARSFSGASRQLEVPVSTVSRKVAQLEKRLGIALLVRTTRQVRPTEAGSAYLEACASLLDGLALAEAAVSEAASTPKGRLVLTAPVEMGSNDFFISALSRFITKYPAIELELRLENRRVDLVAEGVDVALRAGELSDSSLIAQRLGKTCLRLMASAEFLQRHAAIHSVEDLNRVPCIRRSMQTDSSLWQLVRLEDKHSAQIRVHGPIAASSMDAIARFATAGHGVAILPDYRGDPWIERLQVVLPAWTAGESPIHLVYPARRLVPAKLTALLNFLLGEASAGRLPTFTGG